jgi:hypothetical protein
VLLEVIEKGLFSRQQVHVWRCIAEPGCAVNLMNFPRKNWARGRLLVPAGGATIDTDFGRLVHGGTAHADLICLLP